MKWLRNLFRTPELRHFYQEYLDWVEAGALDHRYFNRYEGLCTLLNSWYSYECGVGIWRYAELQGEMRAQFRELGNGDTFPFGREAYRLAKLKGMMHLDTNRMRFVRTKAAGD